MVLGVGAAVGEWPFTVGGESEIAVTVVEDPTDAQPPPPLQYALRRARNDDDGDDDDDDTDAFNAALAASYMISRSLVGYDFVSMNTSSVTDWSMSSLLLSFTFTLTSDGLTSITLDAVLIRPDIAFASANISLLRCDSFIVTSKVTLEYTGVGAAVGPTVGS